MNTNEVADYKQRIRLFLDTSNDLGDPEVGTCIKLLEMLIDYELTIHPNWTSGQAALGILNDIHPEIFQAALVELREDMSQSLGGGLQKEVLEYFFSNRNPVISFKRALKDWQEEDARDRSSIVSLLRNAEAVAADSAKKLLILAGFRDFEISAKNNLD